MDFQNEVDNKKVYLKELIKIMKNKF